MTLDKEDFKEIRRISMETATKSQEALAEMIARQLLGIRQQFQEIQQQLHTLREHFEEGLAELKVELDLTRRRLEELESSHLEKVGRLEGEIRDAHKKLSGLETRVLRLEAA